MAEDRKYYYLKLKDNFFDSDEMLVLENMKDGYLYCNILMKLYLRSLKSDGKLMLNDRIPYNSATLASVVRHSEGVVVLAIKAFQELGLIEVLDSGAIYMLDIQNYIGRSSTEADRKRTYRERIESEKTGALLVDKCPDKYPPEIEIELELEKKIELEKETKQSLFNQFWKAYPKKQNKAYSEQQFKKIPHINSEINHIMYSLDKFKKTKDWIKEDGQYIPNASTWLNQKRWLDFDMEPEQDDEYIPPELQQEVQPLPVFTEEQERMYKEAMRGNVNYDYTAEHT